MWSKYRRNFKSSEQIFRLNFLKDECFGHCEGLDIIGEGRNNHSTHRQVFQRVVEHVIFSAAIRLQIMAANRPEQRRLDHLCQSISSMKAVF